MLIVHILMNVYTALPALAQETSSGLDLTELSPEELANIQIPSVTRQVENLSEAPAFNFVITAYDIRRSGATTCPRYNGWPAARWTAV
jgi:iron complex outermembrane receptor protein